MIKKLKTLILSLTILGTTMTGAALAGIDVFDPCADPAAGDSTVCANTDTGNVLTGQDSILRNGLRIFVFIVGFASIVMVMVGGLKYVTSRGDPQALASSRQTIIYALVGLVIALAAEGIIRFVIDRI